MRINFIGIATLAVGGLGGAMFTWFMTHPRPTVIAYTVNTTTLGADSTIRSLLPDLKIRIGSEEISIIHIHSFDLTVQSGPFADQVTIGIEFPLKVRLFAVSADAPTLHHISCSNLQNGRGIQCDLGPLTPLKTVFHVALAADQKQAPTVITATRNLELVKAEIVPGNPWYSSALWALVFAGTLAGIATAIFRVFSELRVIRQKDLADLSKESAAVQETLLQSRLRDAIPHVLDGDVLRMAYTNEDLTRPIVPPFKVRLRSLPKDVVRPEDIDDLSIEDL
jgi:hypothetical protein